MPSPVSLATVFDMATAVPIAKFITMNAVVTEHYGRLLNTGLYFYQPDGKISVRLIQEAMGIAFFKVKVVVILNDYDAPLVGTTLSILEVSQSSVTGLMISFSSMSSRI